MILRVLAAAVMVASVVSAAWAQDLNAARDDQIDRLKDYVLDAIMPSGLVRDSLVLNGTSFHPATPDAAGFALVALSALDHLGKLADGAQRVEDILSAYAGAPDRSADGHFLHWMDVNTGARASGGWPVEYTPIGSALLAAGAQFARNHFSGNAAIASLADNLTNTIDFNAAIHPSLNGDIYLTMNQFGGGGGGTVHPWNEYMLVESLALRQQNNDRALAVRHLWLDVENLPKRSYLGTLTLTDNPGAWAPAFWVHQMHFFNGDFRHSADFETYFDNHRQIDKDYSSVLRGEPYRYGVTAGLIPPGYPESPYHADSISSHPGRVYSPEAVAAWGDMDTFLEWYNEQDPNSSPSYKYGLVRESALQPSWIPGDAGLVDHLFLLFGLVESIDANFFAERVIPEFLFGDFDHDGDVDGLDFLEWQAGVGTDYDAMDLADWEANYGSQAGLPVSAATSVPEPNAVALILSGVIAVLNRRCRRQAVEGSIELRF